MDKIEQEAFLQQIGRRVKKYRKAQKLSQRQLAFEMGSSESSIRRIEKGEVDLKATTIARLAIALSIAPSQLIGEVE